MSIDNLQTILITANTLGLGWVLVTAKAGTRVPAGAIILDSCALIDGRILQIVQARLIVETIIIPNFILAELQLLADGRDTHKRARARFGLENADSLKLIYRDKLKVDASTVKAVSTDDKLLELAKKHTARLCTTDYNLNKVASVQGISVLNINELAQAVRMVMLPGEQQTIKILQKGEGRGQAIGYLPDGTMVVVEAARKYIGSEQTIIIDRSLQTVAGKMSFAHVISPKA
jgi:uncharacterized protein YacL